MNFAISIFFWKLVKTNKHSLDSLIALMSIRKTNKQTNIKCIFNPAQTACSFLSLGLLSLCPSWEKAAWDPGFRPISLKDDFHILQCGRMCADEVHAGNGSAGRATRGVDVALLCFLSLVCRGQPQSFSLLVLNIYLYSSFLWLLFLPAVTCGGLLGTQSFWGRCKLQAALSPSVFSSESSSVSESWTGDRVLCSRAEFRSIPSSQALAVQKWDFLKRGYLARAGRKGAFAEADAPAFLALKESCSNQTSAVPQTIPSFGEKQHTESLSPVHPYRRLALSMCVHDSKNVMQS